jgi:hypothetical protein
VEPRGARSARVDGDRQGRRAGRRAPRSGDLAFQIVALWAGTLGKNELAANTFVLNLASLSFMLPLGIGLAAATRAAT